MSTVDESDDARLRAGEFVLGTLDVDERERFRSELAESPELQSAVHDWQSLLQPIADRTPPVEPPGSIWTALSARLDELEGLSNDSGPALDAVRDDTAARAAPVEQPHTTRRTRKSRHTRRWRASALVAMAACAVLSLALLQRLFIADPPPPYRGIAIVQNEDAEPLWVIDVADSPASIRVTAYAPPSLDDDRVHQLWMALPDDQGVRSLGLLPGEAGESIVRSIPEDALEILLAERTLGVSIEPPGGSPDPAPSGPVPFHPELRLLSGDDASG